MTGQEVCNMSCDWLWCGHGDHLIGQEVATGIM